MHNVSNWEGPLLKALLSYFRRRGHSNDNTPHNCIVTPLRLRFVERQNNIKSICSLCTEAQGVCLYHVCTNRTKTKMLVNCSAISVRNLGAEPLILPIKYGHVTNLYVSIFMLKVSMIICLFGLLMIITV